MNGGQYLSHFTLKDTNQTCLRCSPKEKTRLSPLTREPPWTTKLSSRMLNFIEMNPSLKTARGALHRRRFLRAKGFYKKRGQRG